MKIVSIDSIKVKIGQNAKENWQILDEAFPGHYFFHLTSFPSCYVILEEEYPSDEMILKCASYCKMFTKYKNLKNLKVDYCKCSNLKKGDILGEVIFISNKKRKKVTV